MDRQAQIGLLKRLLHFVDTKTTALAEAPWRNHVSIYTDPEHAERERQVLFRRHPLLIGFASQWGAPGAFRTDDYAGVPILVTRGRDGKLRAFLNVVVPALRNTIVATLIMVFVFALGSYLLPQILGRPQHWTLSVLITDQAIYQSNMPFAAAMAVFLVLVSLALVGLTLLVGGQREARA